MRIFLAGRLLMLAAAGFISTGVQAVEEGTTFGDWGYKCDQSQQEGGDQLCYVFQNVTKKDSRELVMGARIAYRPDQQQPLLVVTVPLGSLLPPGAALTMDGVEPIKLSYILCTAQGCTTAAQPLTPEMVDAMKKGNQAAVRVMAPNQQPIALPLSLTGFTKALASLKE